MTFGGSRDPGDRLASKAHHLAARGLGEWGRPRHLEIHRIARANRSLEVISEPLPRTLRLRYPGVRGDDAAPGAAVSPTFTATVRSTRKRATVKPPFAPYVPYVLQLPEDLPQRLVTECRAIEST